MHLKLKIHLNGAGRGLLFVIQLALVLVQCQPEARASATSEIPTTSEQHNHHHHQDNYAERMCRPMLNFGLPNTAATQTIKRATSDYSQQQQQQRKLSQSIPDSFSFSIGNIDLPLTPTDGASSNGGGGSVGSSVQTAMKLLAAFDSQLYGDNDDDGEEDDQGESRPHENTIRFMGNKLSISGLNFTMLNVHLYPNGEPKFALGVNIANTTLSGRFLYDGPTPSLIAGDHAQLAAHYRMTIDGVLVTAASNLTKLEVVTTGGAGGVTGPGSRYRLATNELKMNISNLGFISIDILDAEDASRPTSNYMLRMLQRVLQKTIKRTYNTFEEYIRRTLELEGRHFLDCELTRFSPLLVENSLEQQRHHLSSKAPPVDVADLRAKSGPSDPLISLETEVAVKKANSEHSLTSTYLDDVARILGTEIGNSHLSRIGLPDFEYQRGLFGSNANINFSNGSLVGLNNIKLTGETRVKLHEEHLIVNASVGWVDLRPHYNWTLHFGGNGGGQEPPADRRLASAATSYQADGPNQLAKNAGQSDKSNGTANTKARVPMARGFVAFNIKAIDFDAVISKSVRSQSQMVVDQLTIRRLDGPKMDIGGLPGMNRLTRTVVNFFMGRLKQRLVGAIQPALKQELERALNRLALFN